MNSIMSHASAENKTLQLTRIKKDSKIKSQMDNIKFLEAKVSKAMAEKEEVTIKLKSEIIIYKQKAKQYKENLNDQIQKFDEVKEEQIKLRLDEE